MSYTPPSTISPSHHPTRHRQNPTDRHNIPLSHHTHRSTIITTTHNGSSLRPLERAHFAAKTYHRRPLAPARSEPGGIVVAGPPPPSPHLAFPLTERGRVFGMAPSRREVGSRTTLRAFRRRRRPRLLPTTTSSTRGRMISSDSISAARHSTSSRGFPRPRSRRR